MTENTDKLWNYLEERFGVQRADLKGFDIVERSDDYWLVSDSLEAATEDLEVETVGFRFLRETKYGLKPTTYALQFIGDHIEKSIVELSDEEVEKMLGRTSMIDRDLTKGYVALKYDGDVLGCGFFMDGVVSSRIPKGRSNELLQLLDFED